MYKILKFNISHLMVVRLKLFRQSNLEMYPWRKTSGQGKPLKPLGYPRHGHYHMKDVDGIYQLNEKLIAYQGGI